MDMKLKLRTMIVLGSLLIALPLLTFATTPIGNVNVDNTCIDKAYRGRHRHKVHIKIKHRGHLQRSILSCSAYVEDNILYLHFDTPLENVLLDITNVDTGVLIFSGEFTGTSLALPLQEDGYEFNINVDQF